MAKQNRRKSPTFDDIESYLEEKLAILSRIERVENQIVLLNEKFDLFMQQVDKRFEQMDLRMDQIDKRIDQVEKRFDQMDKRFDQIDKRFEQVDKRFESLQHQMDKRFQFQFWATNSMFGMLTLIISVYKFVV